MNYWNIYCHCPKWFGYKSKKTTNQHAHSCPSNKSFTAYPLHQWQSIQMYLPQFYPCLRNLSRFYCDDMAPCRRRWSLGTSSTGMTWELVRPPILDLVNRWFICLLLFLVYYLLITSPLTPLNFTVCHPYSSFLLQPNGLCAIFSKK